MLYTLLYPLRDAIPAFRIFGYVSFRMVFAVLTSMILVVWLGPKFFKFLHSINFKENIRSDGPQTHQEKSGTPTMGGLLIISSMSISLFIWGNLTNIYFLMLWFCSFLLSALGFYDDYCKATRSSKGGIKAGTKFLLQIGIGAIFSVFVYLHPFDDTELHTQLFLPFLKDPIINMGIVAIPVWIFLITGFSNAVNLTDGLDGLATGLSVIALTALSIIVYITGLSAISEYLLIPFISEANEWAIFAGALIGASVAFLWYNSYPAQVFMGDTGSLMLGGAFAMTGILIKREVLILILGAIFVAETLSVILQVGSYKLRKKRIFKMAPLHHHYELGGIHENKIVVRFWIIGILLALVSLSSLKII